MQKIMMIILILGITPMLMGAGSDSGSEKKSSAPTVQNNPNFIAAKTAMKAQNYQNAVALLKKADQAFPGNADVLNLLGYSHRHMKRFKLSLQYYQRALKIEPKHRGANEYLGELYLQTGNLAKAEERLKVLDGACFFGCEEYDDLKEAIEAYKK